MSYHDNSTLFGANLKRSCLKSLANLKAYRRKNDYPAWKSTNILFVGIGASGISIAASLAVLSGKEWGFARKSTDTKNHGGKYHTWQTYNREIWLADDFISSGNTLRNLENDILQWYPQTCVQGAVVPFAIGGKRTSYRVSMPMITKRGAYVYE